MESTSAAAGSGLRSSSATAAMIWPAWQYPHCGTSSSIQAFCTAWSPPAPSPSMVVTCLPASAETGSRQERWAAPSTSTVQAPQKPPPQPNLVPVRRAWSRRYHRSGMSPSPANSRSTALTRKRMLTMLGAYRQASPTRSPFVAVQPRPGAGAPRALLEGDYQLGGMAAPVDRDDVRAQVPGHRDLDFVAGEDVRHRNYELLPEVAARVAGDRVRHLPDQVAERGVAEVRLLQLHEQHGQHGSGRREVHDALALAGDLDHAGVPVHARLALGHEVRRADRRRLLGRDLEVVRRSVDEGLEFPLLQHLTCPAAIRRGPRSAAGR